MNVTSLLFMHNNERKLFMQDSQFLMCRWTFIKLLNQRNAGSSSSLRKTVLEFLLKNILELLKPHTQNSCLLIVNILIFEVASPKSRVVSSGLLPREESEAHK